MPPQRTKMPAGRGRNQQEPVEGKAAAQAGMHPKRRVHRECGLPQGPAAHSGPGPGPGQRCHSTPSSHCSAMAQTSLSRRSCGGLGQVFRRQAKPSSSCRVWLRGRVDCLQRTPRGTALAPTPACSMGHSKPPSPAPQAPSHRPQDPTGSGRAPCSDSAQQCCLLAALSQCSTGWHSSATLWQQCNFQGCSTAAT